MGLKIKSTLREVLAPDAWFPDDAPIVHAGDRGGVDLGDFLTRWMTLDRVKTWTLRALAGKLCQETHSSSELVTLICDDKNHVPKLKKAEQDSRAEDREKAADELGLAPAYPYPYNAVLIPDGIRYTPPDSEEVEEEIDLRRLSLSRWYGSPEDPQRWSNLGNTIWHAMHSDLQDHLAARGVRAREVLFDHCAAMGTVRFTTVPNPETGEWTTLRKEGTVPKHPLGEADTALAWHTKQHDGKVSRIFWDTTDSDLIAVYALYHPKRTQEQRNTTRIWWRPERGVAVDLGLAIELTLAKKIKCDDDVYRSFVSAEAFAFFGQLCGNDFQKHKPYAHGCGVDKMLMAFLRAQDAFDPLDVGPCFELFLRYLHAHKLDLKPAPIPRTHPQWKPDPPLHSIDSIRRKYEERAPRLAKAREGRQKKAMEKLLNKWDHALAPLRTAVKEAGNVSSMLSMEIEAGDSAKRLEEMEIKAAVEVKAMKEKHAEPPWVFPTNAEIKWFIKVQKWVYDYWDGASDGIVPPEPQAAKRTSPFFPASAASSAAASSSSPSKRARMSSDDDEEKL